MNSLIRSEIALTENASSAFKNIILNHKDENSIVLFVTIQGKDYLQGVCKLEQAQLIDEVREDWR